MSQRGIYHTIGQWARLFATDTTLSRTYNLSIMGGQVFEFTRAGKVHMTRESSHPPIFVPIPAESACTTTEQI
jgi:hypothetical protein